MGKPRAASGDAFKNSTMFQFMVQLENGAVISSLCSGKASSYLQPSDF
jgi:hypothetical protein